MMKHHVSTLGAEHTATERDENRRKKEKNLLKLENETFAQEIRVQARWSD